MTIEIQSASSPVGPFTTFATTVSSGNDGQGLSASKPWQVEAVVPQWQPQNDYGVNGTIAKRAYVRAISPVSNSEPIEFPSYPHFDEEGRDPFGCLLSAILGGAPEWQAHAHCQSDSSPVVELVAPSESVCGCRPFSLSGSLVIGQNTNLSAYECLTHIAGDLIVTGDAPQIISLPSLASVGGSVDLNFEFPPTRLSRIQKVTARRMYLYKLSSIGANLKLRSLVYGDSTTLNIPLLKEIPGNLEIMVAEIMRGLDSIIKVGGDLTLWADDVCPSPGPGLDLFPSFDALRYVDGSVTVCGYYAFGNSMNQLETIDGDLNILDLHSEFSPSSFDSLTCIGGNLTVDVNFPIAGSFSQQPCTVGQILWSPDAPSWLHTCANPSCPAE